MGRREDEGSEVRGIEREEGEKKGGIKSKSRREIPGANKAVRQSGSRASFCPTVTTVMTVILILFLFLFLVSSLLFSSLLSLSRLSSLLFLPTILFSSLPAIHCIGPPTAIGQPLRKDVGFHAPICICRSPRLLLAPATPTSTAVECQEIGMSICS